MGSDSKNNKRIEELKQKYEFVLHCDLIPYENIPETISEMVYDLQKIKSINSTSNDKDLVKACEKLDKTLNDITEYLKEKLERFLGIKLDVKR